MEFKGNIPAIVTPFDEEDGVDQEGLKKNIEFVINHIDGVVPCGTTGESPTLSYEEHKHVIEMVIDIVDGRVPVIAGTGSNSTKEAIELTKHAGDVGADGALLIAPYYNKPTQKGIYQHYKAIAENCNLPLVVYNIPSRTGVNIEPSTFEKLAKLENIVGVKEASGNLGQMMKIIERSDLTLLSGDDNLILPVLAIGGKGVISVAANIIPEAISEMIKAFERGDLEKAREINYRYFKLFNSIFLETNPGPIKEAMNMMGLAAGHVRSPLVNLGDENRERLRGVLVELNLIGD
ncbi:MAG: 4-hydroxy-tetrahydrodipicolinate synthase [Candidatus Hydrothermarchaeales archaeon]